MFDAIEKPGFFQDHEQGRILRYGVAPTVVALSLAARALLLPVLHDDTVFLYFMPAVLIAAGIGGLGPGLLATVLNLVAATFIISGALVSSNPTHRQWRRLRHHRHRRVLGRRTPAP